MLSLIVNPGQTGNRLRSLSSLLALGIEYNQNVFCPLVELEECFKFNNTTQIKIRFRYVKIFKIISQLLRLIHKLGFNVGNKRPQKYAGGSAIFTDWTKFAKPELLYKHYSLIKEYFDFKYEHKEKCLQCLKNQKGRVLVAVHLRKVDYREWHGGKYYFNDAEYILMMKKLYEENPDIQFYVFSNEQIDEEVFKETNLPVSIMRGTAMEDLCCMSLCDYIVGPPSTYSAWAGYIGNKKLLWMKEHNAENYSLLRFENVPESMAKTKIFWEI